jgi:hypothetical protein
MEGETDPVLKRRTAMTKHLRLAAALAAALLATACTVYKLKELDGPALAKSKKGTIMQVWTADETIEFSPDDPPVVKDGAVVGGLHMTYSVDPQDIVELSPEKKAARIVLKDGTRFLVASSVADGERILCEAVKPVSIPLDEIVRAQVRTVNTGASVFNTFAGVLLVAGALALDFALDTDDGEFDPTDSFTVDLAFSFIESAPDLIGEGPGRPSNKAIMGMMDASNVAGEKEFWAMEWTPVEARPGEDGKLRVTLDNASAVPRGVDEAKLVVVDHPPGVAVAPDILGAVRSYAGPVPPESATDKSGADIRELVAARDGNCWRTAGGDPAPGAKGLARDEISLSFPRPKGARHARLIVGVSNTAWRSEFAREVLARTAPSPPAPPAAPAGKPPKALRPAEFASPSGYRSWEFTTLRVRVMTVLGWQTGQVLLAVGPRPAEDMIYDIDLSDIPGDKVLLQLSPPAGYWLIDRLALDFGKDGALETSEIAPEAVDGPDAADVLKALAGEDATTVVLYPADPPSELTFILPPPKDGMQRTVFLRTVSCYEMPPKAGAPKTGSRADERVPARFF